MTAIHPPVLGALLAGGLGRRMGEGDKPLRTVAGLTLLERAIAALRPQCAALILNANGDPARFAATELPIVPDSIPDHAGPMAGVLAALDWCAAHRPDIDWVVTAAADQPFLPADLVARLHMARAERKRPLAVAESGGRMHPVNALWPVSLREDLRSALIGTDQRRIGAFIGTYDPARADWPSEPRDPFFNANTPDDLAEAERLAQNISE
ncbi:molybdenum cofactor guanylyltransferase MobA [Terrihabitans sp. B22-R8]|uniref:molybdenum cofactor guanylyltransferase MobA n=1 Tax=Terrihabitans sp. B22-R8 TaxID=3425128 RepID=UPI00403D00BA